MKPPRPASHGSVSLVGGGFEVLSMRALFILVLLGLLIPAAAAAQPKDGLSAGVAEPARPAPPARRVRLEIDTPASGMLVESAMHMAEIRGSALGGGAGADRYDVMLAIDVSHSTRAASGADVDGDGDVGEDPQLGLYAPGEYAEDVRSTDPGDTVLAAEVLAARVLVEGLDSRRVRVGLITFSGMVNPDTGMQQRRDQKDAWLQVPLTDDYGRVFAALDKVARTEPRGATNFAAGIRLATTELAGFSGAESRPSPNAKKVLLFLTDGVPSFPVGKATVSDPGDLEAAVNAARVAHQAGIRINSYALGTEALTRPKGATEIARVTLGTFTPVLEPGAIVAALQSVSFANVEDVGVVNLTTREDAPDVRLSPDGSFVAFVPVKEGRNRVLVNALASDGTQVNREIEFDFQLEESDARMKERELARLRKLNDELIRHVEAERIKAERRRQRMRRELEIRAE